MLDNTTTAIDGVDDIEEVSQRIPINVNGLVGYAERTSCGCAHRLPACVYVLRRHRNYSAECQITL